VARISTLPKRLQPMLATLTDAPFDGRDWIFEDKYDGFRMVATIEGGEVTLYSRNGKIISHNYIEVAKALEGIKHDAVIDGELVAIGAQVHHVAPVKKRIGQSPDLAEKLLDAYGAPVPKRENRAGVEIADQRNIGHDAPAGWKLPFIWPDAAECARSGCAAK